MGGMLWGAALKGLGDAGASLSDSMTQAAVREEQDRREQQRQARLDAQLASQAARGSAARGTIDYSEGTQGEKSMAAKLGMDLPKYRQWRATEDSGDFSAYETDEPVSPIMDRWDAQTVERKKDLSAVQRHYLDDKRRMFAEISQMFMQGDVYDESAKGRLIVKQMGIMADAPADRDRPQDPILAKAPSRARGARASSTTGSTASSASPIAAKQAKDPTPAKGATPVQPTRDGPWDDYPSGASRTQSSGAQSAAANASPTASTRPKPDAWTAKVESELVPLVAQYRQAEQYFQGAARSGDPNAVAFYQAPLLESKRRLLGEVNRRLGNAAESFLDRVGVR